MEGPTDSYEVVIGLEVHCQLSTATKIYSADPNTFGSEPNSEVGIVTMGLPGTLPKLNKKVLEYAIRMGLACNSTISRYNIFDRKNYFYPDLPKGYQLTQDRTPICKGGSIEISNDRRIRLNRIHIEEDAGKSIHQEGSSDTRIDLNRAGVPLIEIVTEPELFSPEEAASLLTEIRKLVRYLEICDGNMERGSMRCDANVSVRKKGSSVLGRKVEIKNMNSIRNVQRAIVVESERQILVLEGGGEVRSETRLFDANRGTTHPMRTKEEMNDYRYFPDPDLSPVEVSEEWISTIRSAMPVLPWERMAQLQKQYGLPWYDAQVLTSARELSELFVQTCEHTLHYKSVSNWLMGPVMELVKDEGSVSDVGLSPVRLAEMVDLVEQGVVSFSSATRSLLPALIDAPDAQVSVLIEKLQLVQDSETDRIELIVDEVLKEFPLKVEEFRRGKKGIIAMFMGEVMKRTKGRVDPRKANELLTQKLKKV
jgi:aspartyl-tRNA(Asn)/glutamyl-tRNA(Gln) amidotransferase subunit B